MNEFKRAYTDGKYDGQEVMDKNQIATGLGKGYSTPDIPNRKLDEDMASFGGDELPQPHRKSPRKSQAGSPTYSDHEDAIPGNPPEEPAKDNWAHRSRGMKCGSCMWFVEKATSVIEPFGRCRRHSPTMSGYPAVYGSDWCGDFKMDEAKL